MKDFFLCTILLSCDGNFIPWKNAFNEYDKLKNASKY